MGGEIKVSLFDIEKDTVLVIGSIFIQDESLDLNRSLYF